MLAKISGHLTPIEIIRGLDTHEGWHIKTYSHCSNILIIAFCIIKSQSQTLKGLFQYFSFVASSTEPDSDSLTLSKLKVSKFIKIFGKSLLVEGVLSKDKRRAVQGNLFEKPLLSSLGCNWPWTFFKGYCAQSWLYALKCPQKSTSSQGSKGTK